MKNSEHYMARLRRVLSIDKNLNIPERLCDLVRSDIATVLQNYFTLDDVVIELKHDGEKYSVLIEAFAHNIKTLNLL
jgi:septum formation topological specificity factor MinE